MVKSNIARLLKWLKPWNANLVALENLELSGLDMDSIVEERRFEEEARSYLLSCRRRENAYKDVYNKLYLEYLKPAPCSIFSLSDFVDNPICNLIGTGKKVLDIGCGQGILSLALALRGNYVHGVDISDVNISVAQYLKKLLKVDNVDFSVMNATKLNFPADSFDYLISIDLVEHLCLEDVIAHLKEALRVLKKNGAYIIITPNRLAGFKIPLHLHEFTIEELTRLLLSIGFSSIKAFLFRNWKWLPVFLCSPTFKICLERMHKLFKLTRISYQLLWLDYCSLMAIK
jgi:2-polyprenyl-3-methyl-5-hydroxy-6-metoxy-1,4-benzoquinol methylase